MHERIFNNRISKHIVTKYPAAATAAKVSAHKLCHCPSSEPGKVKIDSDKHVLGCRFRKLSSQYGTKTSVIPSRIVDGCSLGVALGEEYY